jgi:hypothetical protein
MNDPTFAVVPPRYAGQANIVICETEVVIADEVLLIRTSESDSHL